MQIKRIPIVLDLQNKGQPILIPAKQADTGRILEFKICNGAESVEVKNDPVLSVKKASGKRILNECGVENGDVLVKLTNQILAETGRQKAELIFKDADGTVKSFIFWLDVEETTYDPDAIMSQNEFDALDKWAQEWDDRVEEVIKRADQQYEEMKKQAALIGDGNVGTVTGSRVDFESLDSAAVVKEIPGKTVQDRSTGAQLFDASKLPTKTQGGATVTNNGDGSFTVSGSGNLAERYTIEYVFTHEKTIEMLKAGRLTLNFNGNSYPRPYVQLNYRTDGDTTKPVDSTYFTLASDGASTDIAESMLNDLTVKLYLFFVGNANQPIKPGTIRPMLYQDGDGTWEPYTGGKPTPRPGYPVMVQGVGDSGYFDGALLQGYYSTTDGSFKVSDDLVCNANRIPCKTGDALSIIVDDKDVEEIFFLFYRSDGSFVGNSPNKAVKAPEGAEYFCFRVQKTGITPYNAGHIAITINGKYMAMVKSRTANLFDYRRIPSKTQGGATVTNNGDGSFTISGSGNLSENPYLNYTIMHDEIVKMFKAGKVHIKLEKPTNPYFYVNVYKNNVFHKTLFSTINTAQISNDILTEYINDNSYKFLLGFGGVKGSTIKSGTIKPMLYQDGDGIYQPYKESSAMIPIDYPLYEGDKICQKDGELWIHRENAMAVFDGSEDEKWVLYNGQFYIVKDDMKKSNSYVDNLFCDRFQTDTNNSAKNDNTITGHWDSTLYPDKNWIYITKTDVESVSALKTWLQSNPVTVVYKLAVPVKKRITAEEAYNLRTYAPYSTIWTPDDMDPEFLVDTAKNLAGVYALEGYAQAKKNEMIKDNGSEINQLSQRIEKIEELMKNTLTIAE